MNAEQQVSFNGWAKVEVMGHQTHIGYVRTEAYGQAVMFRVDVPGLPEREYILEEPAWVGPDGAHAWTRAGAKVQRVATPGHTVLIGAGSIYRILPCSEAAALKAIESSIRSELKLIEPPPERALAAGSSIDSDADDCDNDPDDDEDQEDELERLYDRNV